MTYQRRAIGRAFTAPTFTEPETRFNAGIWDFGNSYNPRLNGARANVRVAQASLRRLACEFRRRRSAGN